MNKIIKNKREGFVIVRDGKYWGVQYSDGHSHCEDFGDFDKVRFFYIKLDRSKSPEYYVTPNHHSEIRGGKFVEFVEETTYTFNNVEEMNEN
jgi:hypothetical protein